MTRVRADTRGAGCLEYGKELIPIPDLFVGRFVVLVITTCTLFLAIY